MLIDLNEIAAVLEGLEETIIHRIIDRGQYLQNDIVYKDGMSGFAGGGQESLLDIRLRMQEEMDSRFGRFCVPEERPFCRGLPSASRQIRVPDHPLCISDFDAVNLTAEIKKAYLCGISGFCMPGDDMQYGSTVESDVAILQAVARRIHFGALYVAESKFRAQSDEFLRLVAAADRDAVLALLTRREVEEAILQRISIKVDTIQSRINTLVRRKIDPAAIMSFYRDYIIPLTKEGEVRYLFLRAAVNQAN